MLSEPDVQEHDVRAQRRDEPGGAGGIAGLADDADPSGEAGEHRLKPGQDHFMVVDEHDPYGGGHCRNITRGATGE